MSYRDHGQRFTRARGAIARVAALALLVAPTAARAATVLVIAAAPPVAAAEQFGANTGVLFNSGRYTTAQIDQQLAALAQTGATIVRSDALWEDSEPQPPIGFVHRYDSSFDDRVVGALAAHGLQWLPNIDYSTSWAQSAPGQDHSPPALASDYAAYAGALAARYGPGGAYADLYANASAAITAVEPGARVVIGGLARPAWFLSAMLAAESPACAIRSRASGSTRMPQRPAACSRTCATPALRCARTGWRASRCT